MFSYQENMKSYKKENFLRNKKFLTTFMFSIPENMKSCHIHRFIPVNQLHLLPGEAVLTGMNGLPKVDDIFGHL
jgi:hypothetical protein